MKIKVSRYWKELVDQKPHPTLSRRDFVARGLATGTATLILPHALVSAMARKAYGDASSCPPQVRQTGALAQLIRDGGPTVGAMFLTAAQANGMTAAAASNYGITAGDIAQVGQNWYLSKSSAFAIGLMTPPPGYTVATWAAVLMKTSLGGHFGPFNQDDGAGQDLGMPGGAGSYKPSLLAKDIRFNSSEALASWANGLPSIGVSGSTSSLTPAKVAKNFSITPAGKITTPVMTNSAVAADALGAIFAGVFNLGSRKFGTQTVSKASCGFYGDAVMASPTFGTSLFDPTQITALSTATIQAAKLTQGQQAMLASFYQSAIGTLGGVIYQQNGCDYHGQSVQTTIGPSDLEAGQIVALFIAACDAAQVPGAMISVANGQAVASGTVAATVTDINGATQNINGASAQGDAGGSYNAGFLLAYHPSSPPTLKVTGTFDMSSGNAKASSTVGSVPNAIAGLYLTAFTYLGLNVGAATNAMAAAGISNPSSLMLI